MELEGTRTPAWFKRCIPENRDTMGKRSRKTICLVAGARPNFMKIAPLLENWKERRDVFDPFLVHTGQHYDPLMSKIFFEDLGLPEPDVSLGVGSASHAVQTAKIMTAFEAVVKERRPDLVVVVGDVNSTVACGLTAAKLQIPVAHVEAGLRSGDRAMPEEINRILTDHLSDLLFTTCSDGDENLLREGIDSGKIHFVGNLMIESLIRRKERFSNSDIHRTLSLRPGGYVLVTLHRPSNVDDPAALKGLLQTLARIAEDAEVVFPVHPRTAGKIREFGLEPTTPGLRLIDPVGYIDFMALEMRARLVITDSGGIQEETTYFQVPCLTVRENTERPITMREGSNRLVGTDPEALLAAAGKVLAGDVPSGTIPKYWDEEVSARITRVLETSDLLRAQTGKDA